MDASRFRPSDNVSDQRGHPTLSALMSYLAIPYPHQIADDVRNLFQHPMTPVDQIDKVPNMPGGLPEQAGINDIKQWGLLTP